MHFCTCPHSGRYLTIGVYYICMDYCLLCEDEYITNYYHIMILTV